MDGYDSRTSVTISVRGLDPVSWSAPHVSRWGGSIPNVALTEWKGEVSRAALEAFGPYLAWTGPIELRATFWIRHGMPKKRSAGEYVEEGRLAYPTFTWDDVYCVHRLKYKPPDLTNLIKAAEDACEGIVFVDDAQVCSHGWCSTRWSMNPGLELTFFRGAN